MKTLNLITKREAAINSIDINEEDIDMDFFENIEGNRMIIRATREFAGKAIILDDAYDYVIGVDSTEMIILVPLKKK